MDNRTVKPLTPKQEAFALAYVLTGNACEAYRRSYDCSRMKQKTLEPVASKMLAHPKVGTRIAELRANIAERSEITVEKILRGLWDNYEKAMRHTPVLNQAGEPTGEYRYEGAVANRALELMGRHLGMFPRESSVSGTIKHEVQPTIDPEEYTTGQLRAIRDGYRKAELLAPAAANVVEGEVKASG